ncbi:MAG: hypothetical protein H8M99_07730 [Gloeobacteraceae cyanobacterium ES-bin-144]|nr:hypothetical protein [Verrucomicrobiales bacterium]
MESLDAGGYNGTPVGDMLPVYLEPGTPQGIAVAGRYDLTREGRLEPWARLRLTEEAEALRLHSMPDFLSIHRLSGIRPGAMEIGKFETAEGTNPALAVRRYGRGRTAVLAIADYWCWGMKNPESRRDMDKSWRQMLRWLLADVPRPLALKTEINSALSSGHLITAELLGNDFQPRESGSVGLRVQRPDGTWSRVSLQPNPTKAGKLEANYIATPPGAYLAEATTDKPTLVARAGWVVNATQDEYLAIQPDMPTMNNLATTTGGRVISPSGLDAFVASLENLPLPITETRSQPLWNNAYWMLAALTFFIGEWSLRRWKNLP